MTQGLPSDAVGSANWRDWASESFVAVGRIRQVRLVDVQHAVSEDDLWMQVGERAR